MRDYLQNGMEWNGIEWNGMEWNRMESYNEISVIFINASNEAL